MMMECLVVFIINTLCDSIATEVAQDLRKYIVEIYDDFLSPDGLVRKKSHACACACMYVCVYANILTSCVCVCVWY